MKRSDTMQPSTKTTSPRVTEGEGDFAQDVLDARNIIVCLKGSIKSYAIYPDNHIITLNYISRLQDGLDEFLSRYGVLRLTVDSTRLLYKDVAVHEDEEQEGNIAYIFSRDGVLWIEFWEGVKRKELEDLIEMISGYRIITQTTDGDIVTALWGSDFPHIKYEVVDLILKNGPPLDLSKYQAIDSEELESGREAKTTRRQDGQEEVVPEVPVEEDDPMPIMAADKQIWGLTDEEELYLNNLVFQEENRDQTKSVAEVLILFLIVQNDEKDFIKTLLFLEDRFVHAVKIGQFSISYTILYNINKLQKSINPKKKWMFPHLKDFLKKLSLSKCFSVLPRFLLEQEVEVDETQVKFIWPTLLLLTPDIVRVLGPIFPKITQSKEKKQLVRLIISHGTRDIDLFHRILLGFDEKLILRFLPVIGEMKEKDREKVLLRLVKHEDDTIRNRASRALLANSPHIAEKLIFLLDDPVAAIRKRLLVYFAQGRNKKIEKFLLNYFHGPHIDQHEPEHLLACYHALGNCGSVESIPYLKKMLLEKSFKNMFLKGAYIHKKGAAQALRALGLPEADRILKKGRNGFIPSIRMLCRQALQEGHAHAHESL